MFHHWNIKDSKYYLDDATTEIFGGSSEPHLTRLDIGVFAYTSPLTGIVTKVSAQYLLSNAMLSDELLLMGVMTPTTANTLQLLFEKNLTKDLVSLA